MEWRKIGLKCGFQLICRNNSRCSQWRQLASVSPLFTTRQKKYQWSKKPMKKWAFLTGLEVHWSSSNSPLETSLSALINISQTRLWRSTHLISVDANHETLTTPTASMNEWNHWSDHWVLIRLLVWIKAIDFLNSFHKKTRLSLIQHFYYLNHVIDENTHFFDSTWILHCLPKEKWKQVDHSTKWLTELLHHFVPISQNPPKIKKKLEIKE